MGAHVHTKQLKMAFSVQYQATMANIWRQQNIILVSSYLLDKHIKGTQLFLFTPINKTNEERIQFGE